MQPSPSPLCVIGDLHGRTKTLSRILADAKAKNPDYHYVFIGDILHHKAYFTRTKKTSPIKLLRSVKKMTESNEATLLRGNNEQYIIDNIDTPLKLIKSNQVRYTVECLKRLQASEISDIMSWLNSLPTHVQIGQYRLAHAYYPSPLKPIPESVIVSGPGYPWFKKDPLSQHLDSKFTYVLGHYGYPFIKANLKIIDATLFEGVGVYYTDRDEFMVYY